MPFYGPKRHKIPTTPKGTQRCPFCNMLVSTFDGTFDTHMFFCRNEHALALQMNAVEKEKAIKQLKKPIGSRLTQVPHDHLSDSPKKGHKVCPSCGREKATPCFGKDRARKDGLAPICRDCSRESRRVAVMMQTPTITPMVPLEV